ncbi:hypothetical protein EON66_07770 [archaeon]|nr:MAG: hypothetical protein EON66_07770 [archaeon]
MSSVCTSTSMEGSSTAVNALVEQPAASCKLRATSAGSGSLSSIITPPASTQSGVHSNEDPPGWSSTSWRQTWERPLSRRVLKFWTSVGYVLCCFSIAWSVIASIISPPAWSSMRVAGYLEVRSSPLRLTTVHVCTATADAQRACPPRRSACARRRLLQTWSMHVDHACGSYVASCVVVFSALYGISAVESSTRQLGQRMVAYMSLLAFSLYVRALDLQVHNALPLVTSRIGVKILFYGLLAHLSGGLTRLMVLLVSFVLAVSVGAFAYGDWFHDHVRPQVAYEFSFVAMRADHPMSAFDFIPFIRDASPSIIVLGTVLIFAYTLIQLMVLHYVMRHLANQMEYAPNARKLMLGLRWVVLYVARCALRAARIFSAAPPSRRFLGVFIPCTHSSCCAYHRVQCLTNTARLVLRHSIRQP